MISKGWNLILIQILLVFVLFATAVSFIPDNPYERWQLLDNTIHYQLRWIYERINFDRTPVDLAIIGSSRTQAAISVPRLERDLAAMGAKVNAVNLSIPTNGRDLHYVILQQLLAHKHPDLVLIAIAEQPSRSGHEAFKYVAPAAEILFPGYLTNIKYPANVTYLPFRQLRLNFADLFPLEPSLSPTFDPNKYEGKNFDSTGSFMSKEGVWVDKDTVHTPAELEKRRAHFLSGEHAPYLGEKYFADEFGDENHYIQAMLDLARSKHVRVAFIFLPYYNSPCTIAGRQFYTAHAAIIDACEFARHSEFYTTDVRHLNHPGALRLTDWLAPKLVSLMH